MPTGLVLMGVVCAAASALPEAQPPLYPKVTNPPKFKWTTLGGMVFAHTGQANEYTHADLQLLSKFSMVQFDKKQSISNMSQATYDERWPLPCL